MSAKNGVITEKRFKDMTLIQWYFHYVEVIRERERARKSDDERFEALFSYLELVVKAINPELSVALQEAKEAKRLEAEMPAEKFEDAYEDIFDKVPDTLTLNIPSRKGRVNLPSYQRKKPGITMPKEESK